MKKILIVGGHLTPALAVLDQLLKEEPALKISWAGNKFSQTDAQNFSIEYQLVKKLGIKFVALQAGKIWRKWTRKTFFKGLKNLGLIPFGFFQSLMIILRLRPNLILAFGGYLALPLVFWGKIFGSTIFVHEQTVTVGLANKLSAKFASKIFLTFSESAKFFPSSKTIVSGNPLRPEVLNVTTTQFNFANKLPIIYITGGNQGANTINWRLQKFLPELLSKANVIHQVGESSLTKDLQQAAKTAAELPLELKERYVYAANFFGPEIGEIMHKANLLVSRSGANITCEILTLGKLALLLPLPWSSHQEQLKNARLLDELGLGHILEPYDTMPAAELAAAIDYCLGYVQRGKLFNGQNLSSYQAPKLHRQAATLISEQVISFLQSH